MAECIFRYGCYVTMLSIVVRVDLHLEHRQE